MTYNVEWNKRNGRNYRNNFQTYSRGYPEANLVSPNKTESQGSNWFWRKKIQRVLSEETRDLQDLQSIPILAVVLGPANWSICISISTGIRSKSPNDGSSNPVDEFSKGNRDRVETDPQTFLSNIAIGKLKGRGREEGWIT